MPASSAPTTPTGDPAAAFFDELGQRRNEPLLSKVSGHIRFDLVDGGQTGSWLVSG